MKIVNGECRGMDFCITGPDDVIQPLKSIFLCSFQFAYSKVFFVNCTFNMPLTALSVTALEDYGTNSQNKALRIVDPEDPDHAWGHDRFMAEKGIERGPIDSNEWAIFMNITFDFCHLPVYIFGRGCEITYAAPRLDTRLFTVEEWRRLECAFGEEYVRNLIGPHEIGNRAQRRRMKHAANRFREAVV